MSVLYFLVGAAMLWAARSQLRHGFRLWKNGGRVGERWLKSPLYSPRVQSALERALIPTGMGTALIGLMLVGAALAALFRGPQPVPLLWVEGVGGFGGVVFIFVGQAVMFLNRPKFLVPSGLRSEAGIAKLWWQDKKRGKGGQGGKQQGNAQGKKQGKGRR